VAGQLPPADWVIGLKVNADETREVRIQAQTKRGQHWLVLWKELTDAA
jgi:hypothetical protein